MIHSSTGLDLDIYLFFYENGSNLLAVKNKITTLLKQKIFALHQNKVSYLSLLIHISIC